MKIRFSHKYTKLLNPDGNIIEQARLLGVFELDLAELHPAFLSYDTDDGIYTLPKYGPYLMLLFEKCGYYYKGKNLFTTLRRFTPEKVIYYEHHIGQLFNVAIEQSFNERRNDDEKGSNFK